MLYERSMKWSDVAILAFTFCSRVLFVLNMAEKQSQVGIASSPRVHPGRWGGATH